MLRSVLTFSLVAGLLTVTPGPDSLLVLRTAVVEGRRTAMVTGAGICLGLLVWGSAAALGVTALLAASRTLFTALRWAGGAYLVWVGVALLRGGGANAGGEADDPGGEADDPGGEADDRRGAGFRRGLLTNLVNPKIGVFYLTFLPQFVPAGRSVLLVTLLLTLVHVLQGVVWFFVLATLAARLSRVFQRPAVTRWLERTAAAVFVGFGVRLAFSRR